LLKSLDVHCVIAAVLLLCASTSACNSKTITRSKAAELVKSARFNPKATEESAQFLEFRPQTNGVVSDSDLTDLRRLEKAGWRIPTARREFVGVTGITMRTPTVAAAEYTWRWVLTDRGRQLGIEPSEASAASAEFQLFEDGWRIVN